MPNNIKSIYLKGYDIVIDTNRYGGFEQVGAIGHNIDNNDVQMSTKPGDNELHIKENNDIYDFSLSDNDMKKSLI